jgi:hypothetical protein
MLVLVNNQMLVLDTIAGGGVRWANEARADDTRLASLWHHASVKTALPREYRAELIREASRFVVEGNA